MDEGLREGYTDSIEAEIHSSLDYAGSVSGKLGWVGWYLPAMTITRRQGYSY